MKKRKPDKDEVIMRLKEIIRQKDEKMREGLRIDGK